MTIKNRGGVFGRNPTFNDVNVDGTLSISGAAVPAPADTLTTSDIGSTVQAYDATILKSADIGSTVQGYDATILTSSDIGSTVQAYDADTAKLDVNQTWTGTQAFNGAVVINEAGADVDFRIESDTNTHAFFLDGTNGNVGIGASSLGQKLEVTGNIKINSGVFLSEIGTAAAPGYAFGDDTDTGMFNISNADLGFTVGGTERMRIDSSGNLLVGVTSNPATGDTGFGIDAGASYMIRSSIAGTGTSEHARFHNSNGLVGGITTSGSATAFNTSSDYRLKEDWVPMSDSIARVKSLNPVNFAWKVDGTRVDGFLAHEAQEIVPEAVTGTKDAVDAEGNPEYQGIDQAKLVPLLTAALQEAIGRIETLEAEVAALKGA